MFSIHCDPHCCFPQRGYRIKPTNNQKTKLSVTGSAKNDTKSKHQCPQAPHLQSLGRPQTQPVSVTGVVGAKMAYLTLPYLTKKRRRGTGTGEQRASGTGDSEESEEEG